MGLHVAGQYRGALGIDRGTVAFDPHEVIARGSRGGGGGRRRVAFGRSGAHIAGADPGNCQKAEMAANAART